jgi:hypothetical protein
MHGERESLNRYIVTSENRFTIERITLQQSRCLLRLGLRFVFERALGLIDNRFERVLVGDREIGQNFAIESDAGGFQSFGEPAVSKSVSARGGIEPLDPQVTESAL